MGPVAEAEVKDTEADLTEDEKASAEEQAGFDAAIEGVDLPKTEEVKEDGTEVAQEVEQKEDDKKEEKKEPEKVEPALAKVTEDQFNHLLATATTVKELTEGLKKLRDDAYGKIGGIERLLKQVERSNESGLDLTLTDDDFKEVDNEVPMLTKPLQKLVNKILKNAKVKVPSIEPVDIDAVRQTLAQELEEKMQKARVEDYQRNQRDMLTDRFPDWQETVAKQEFHTWLAAEDKLSPGYQDRFLSSWNAREIGGVLKKFNAHQEAAEKAKTQAPPPVKSKPKATPSPSNDRKERLKQSIPPKASSSTPTPKGPLTEEEAFEAVG